MPFTSLADLTLFDADMFIGALLKDATMIIQGYFIGDAPYFPVRLGRGEFEGMVWLLADTGAPRKLWASIQANGRECGQ